MKTKSRSLDLLQRIDAYWRAANYLWGGQIFLADNPLLKRRLALTEIKRILLGHCGTIPGQNFSCVYLNCVINEHDLDMIYVSGPGHGGPGLVATPTLKALTLKFIPTSRRTRRGCSGCSISSPFLTIIMSHPMAA